MPSRSAPQPPCFNVPGRMLPPQLAARCEHMQPDASHEPFCFELFRRAIVDRSSLCWHYVHNHYYSLVCYWIRQRTSPDADTVEDLVQSAFLRFWRCYTATKLDCAKSLGAVLAYLKSCAGSAVMDAHRRAERRPSNTAWDERIVDDQAAAQSTEASALGQTMAQSLWDMVEAACQDERERVVARLVFLNDLKPGEVVERHPDLFADVFDVYRVKRNLTDRLRRHPDLQAMRQND